MAEEYHCYQLNTNSFSISRLNPNRNEITGGHPCGFHITHQLTGQISFHSLDAGGINGSTMIQYTNYSEA
jgi:hypothetical protein